MKQPLITSLHVVANYRLRNAVLKNATKKKICESPTAKIFKCKQ